jgi:SpoVK/Ycf46/Vps4 family AAA+-type ATPase
MPIFPGAQPTQSPLPSSPKAQALPSEVSSPSDHSDRSSKAREGEPSQSASEQFPAREPERSLEEVVHPAKVRAQLNAALDRLRHSVTLFDEWGLSAIDPHGARAVLNFYGPPGTGKSMTAEAIAHHMGKRVITVSYAELESKYVGDTPKNIRRAFQAAREQDALIFFDEADSILGKRLSSVTQSADHGVNVSRSVMLMEMDRFDGLLIFATNLAQNYDSAFVRRIQTHIALELPDEAGREAIAEKMLVAKLPREPQVTPKSLAQLSEGLSGGDLRTVVINAASHAVSREGEDRLLKLSDLERCVAEVREAKEEVAATKARAPQEVEEQELSPEEVPSEVRARYEEATQSAELESASEAEAEPAL